MDRQIILTLSENTTVFKVFFTVLCVFLVASLINICFGRHARLFVYRLRSLLLYSLFRHSFGFTIILMTFGFIGLVSFFSIKKLFPFGFLQVVLPIAFSAFLLIHLIYLLKSLFYGKVFGWANLKNIFNRDRSTAFKGLFKAILVLSVPAIIYFLFIKTELGVEITYVILRYGLLIVGTVVVPFFFILTVYNKRIILWKYLFKDKLSLWTSDIVRKYRFCYVINGKNKPGYISDFMNLSAMSDLDEILKRGKRALDLPELTDMPERFKTYVDYDNVLNEEFDSTNLEVSAPDAPFGEAEMNWITRSLSRPIQKLSPARLFLLDSADYDVKYNKNCDRFLLNISFIQKLSSVYLLIGPKTAEKDIMLFNQIMATNNILLGYIIIQDETKNRLLKNHFQDIPESKIITTHQKNKKDLIDTILKNETKTVQNIVKHRSALGELADLEIARMKIEECEKAIETGDIDETEGIQLIEDNKKLHEEKLDTRMNNFFGAKSPVEEFPDSIALCAYHPAKNLIRSLAEEGDYSTRIYIMFNLIEMMVKTMIFAQLLWLPQDHTDFQNFPNSITGQANGQGNIADFADDTHYIYRSAMSYHRYPIKDLPDPLAQLYECLLEPIDTKFNEDIERLRIFFPFLIEDKVETLAELLPRISFLRNQIRGHGIVTNFLAAISYPSILKYLDFICSALNTMELNAKRLEHGTVELYLRDHKISGQRLIQYDESLRDYIFLEGYRKHKPCYIAYSAGIKYRPAVKIEA